MQLEDANVDSVGSLHFKDSLLNIFHSSSFSNKRKLNEDKAQKRHAVV